MKSNTALVLFFLGLILALGGVGGVEQSLDTTTMIQSTVIAIVGLAIMYCGVTALNVSEYYDSQRG